MAGQSARLQVERDVRALRCESKNRTLAVYTTATQTGDERREILRRLRFAAGARLSVSVAFDSSVFALYLRYSTICSIYLASWMHDLNRAFATLCAGSVRRGAGAASDYRRLVSEPSGSGAAPPYIAQAHGDAPQPPSAYT